MTKVRDYRLNNQCEVGSDGQMYLTTGDTLKYSNYTTHPGPRLGFISPGEPNVDGINYRCMVIFETEGDGKRSFLMEKKVHKRTGAEAKRVEIRVRRCITEDQNRATYTRLPHLRIRKPSTRYMLRFSAGKGDKIGKLAWTHDADVPNGEVFEKESQGKRASNR